MTSVASAPRKVLSIEDHALFRDGLRAALTEVDPDVEVLEADEFGIGLERVEEHRSSFDHAEPIFDLGEDVD